MQEQIGKVTIQYREEEILLQTEALEDARIWELLAEGYDCRQQQSPDWPVLYHLSHLRANLTQWLPVKKTDRVLEFGADSGELTGGFAGKAAEVICLEENFSRCKLLATRHQDVDNLVVYAGDLWKNLEQIEGNFDWIIAPGIVSEAQRYFAGENPQVQALKILKKRLHPKGHLVLAVDNRFGMKYWAGAMEPHTGRYFDSLEGNGSTCSRKELEVLLEKSGLGEYRMYYPYPERWFPMSMYSDHWLPGAGELNQNLRNFEGERLVLFDEEKVYDQIIADGRFPEFSNTFLIVAGPERTDLPVYVKYSNDRAKEFMIRTDILKTEDGCQVRKVPVSQEAKAHVTAMKHWEEVLGTQYAAACVKVNRCELKEDAAYFEFLSGHTLEERLDDLRAQKEYGKLAEALQEYKKLLLECLQQELQPFAVSPKFVEMFGTADFKKAYLGAPVNNLDWIFGNLMETEDGTQIIDYEWTFDVQVPVEYLIWRAVSLYLHSRSELKQMGYLAQLGISTEEEKIFEEMEHHFQLWLLGGTVTIGAQYLHTAGRTWKLEQLLKNAKKDQIQVYTDCGQGFSENNSFWIETEPDKERLIRLTILLPAGCKAVRLDPAEETCLVKVRRILGELGGSYELPWSHNGRELENTGIVYTTEDPQLLISGIVEGTSRLYVELSVQTISPDAAYACMNLLNRVRRAERLYNSAPFKLLKKLKRTGK